MVEHHHTDADAVTGGTSARTRLLALHSMPLRCPAACAARTGWPLTSLDDHSGVRPRCLLAGLGARPQYESVRPSICSSNAAWTTSTSWDASCRRSCRVEFVGTSRNAPDASVDGALPVSISRSTCRCQRREGQFELLGRTEGLLGALAFCDVTRARSAPNRALDVAGASQIDNRFIFGL